MYVQAKMAGVKKRDGAEGVWDGVRHVLADAGVMAGPERQTGPVRERG